MGLEVEWSIVVERGASALALCASPHYGGDAVNSHQRST